MVSFPEIRVFGVTGIPEVHPGNNLADLIVRATQGQGTPLEENDILVVTQKVVSKSEGCVVDLRTIEPSAFAQTLAAQWDKDARHVEVVLRESRRIVRMDHGVVIAETRHGLICANAGVDASNIPGDTTVATLPVDPDASAKRLRAGIKEQTGLTIAVIISDTFGRPWRIGSTDVAIGTAGINPLKDYRGEEDPYGYSLRVSIVATADEVSGAAELVNRKTQGVPVAVLRGLPYEHAPEASSALIREPGADLFR
jgi:coenzyme F420-0:L-glutamate ligase/coenzyme F420-1:gamma-L-glutamate ligase